jgi:hypothetical protein
VTPSKDARGFPSPAFLSAARQRWSSPAFGEARAALNASCASALAGLPAVPDRRAGYYHDYFCPDHAVQLVPDMADDRRHACPVDGADFRGERYDVARLWTVNHDLSEAALRLALRFALDPDAPTAGVDRAAVRNIILGYEAAFARVAAERGGLAHYPGLVCFSGLDDSVWLVRMAWAYGLTAGQTHPGERRRVETGLLAPMAAHLRRIRCPPVWPEVDNIAVWNDAASIVTAIVLGDERALREAVDGRTGLRDQLARGVRADGLWWEGSPSYHFYTLAAAVWAVRTLRASARGFADMDVLRRMFRAPLALALPDLSLPALNDGWYDLSLTGRVGHDIPAAAGFYETASAWFGDDEFVAVLARNLAERPRDSLDALLDGSADAAGRSTNDLARPFVAYDTRPSGLAVLRGDDDDAPAGQLVAILKAGPESGGHAHADQLSIQLYGAGTRLLDDLGTAGYGIDLNANWYRTTVSHNTIVIGGRSQPPTVGEVSSRREGDHALVAEGKVVWPSDAGTLGADDPYAGASARRRIALADGYLVDLVDVTCERPRTIDWLLLPLGALDPASGGVGERTAADVLGGEAGYRHIRHVCAAPIGLRRLAWNAGPAAALDVDLGPSADDAPESVFMGDAPGNPASTRIGALIRRRRATHARFATVLIPVHLGHRTVQAVSWSPPASDDGPLVEVVIGRRRDAWSLEDGNLRLTSTRVTG